ncbi:Polynucleotide 5'-hydroxyl-kinase [Gongronella butleri]|nr:Polynucleotide 5'-hydroxyl-kinase [Gongronella butleri]
MKRSATSSDETNKKTKIHPFFDKQSASSSDDGMRQVVKWIPGIESMLMAISRSKEAGRSKMAAFDLDSTLIKTKSGNVFPKNKDDWMWWHFSVPERLEQLHSDGYKIVILSNQAGIKSPQHSDSFKAKMNAILAKINVPVFMYASIKKDIYRKPSLGMIEYMLANHNDDVDIDRENSFYVGDAAGRAAGWKKGFRKDHSCGDRKMADNLGVAFHTPEAYFLGEKEAPFTWGDFDPRSYAMPNEHHLPSSTPLVPADKHQELVIFTGPPASGKSTFAKTHLADYVHVNQDTLKSRPRCLRTCGDALRAGKSVVIDNTNAKVSIRAEYVTMAKDLGVPVRCFVFSANLDLCRHNNHYRHLHSKGDIALLPRIAFDTYRSNAQSPDLKEGYTEIKHIPFKFTDDEKLPLWRKWYD